MWQSGEEFPLDQLHFPCPLYFSLRCRHPLNRRLFMEWSFISNLRMSEKNLRPPLKLPKSNPAAICNVLNANATHIWGSEVRQLFPCRLFLDSFPTACVSLETLDNEDFILTTGLYRIGEPRYRIRSIPAKDGIKWHGARALVNPQTPFQRSVTPR